MSFDVWRHNLPRIEIYGTDGTLSVSDPNTFDGPVNLYKPGTDPKSAQCEEMPLTHIYPENSRGMGVADMAYAIHGKRKHRASGELAHHVLDAMLAFEDSSKSGKHISLTSTTERPDMLPLGLANGTLDE